MFKGLHSAISGMTASSRRQEMLTNNLSNAQTPGYKADQAAIRAFPEMLLKYTKNAQVGNKNLNIPGQDFIGRINTGVYLQEAIPLFMQGDLRDTAKATDIAIYDAHLPVNPETGQKGHLFYVVQVGENEYRYTRNGQFSLSPDGYLTTSEGHYVLNSDLQPMQVGQAGWSISRTGQVVTANNENLGTIALAYTEEPQSFVKEGSGLLRFTGQLADGQAVLPRAGQAALPVQVDVQLFQGFLEGSNVDLTMTMTEMLHNFRWYESNQRVIQAYDRSLEKAANEIGRV